MDGFKANAKMGFGSNYCWCDTPVKMAEGGKAKSPTPDELREMYAKNRNAKTPKDDRPTIDMLTTRLGEKRGGSVKSKVNAAGNYTKPGMRKALFNQIKASATQGTGAGQWSARKAQLLAKKYKEKGGGYKD